MMTSSAWGCEWIDSLMSGCEIFDAVLSRFGAYEIRPIILNPNVEFAVSAKIPIPLACLVIASQRRQVRDGQPFSKNVQ